MNIWQNKSKTYIYNYRRLKSMLFWDVNNGIARRAWARNKEANFAIKREMERTPNLKVTLANMVDEDILNNLFFINIYNMIFKMTKSYKILTIYNLSFRFIFMDCFYNLFFTIYQLFFTNFFIFIIF